MMLLDNNLVFECNRASFQSLANYQSKLYFSKNSLEEKKMSNTTKINFRQKQILAEFMSEHTDLAKGVLPNTSQGKATANRLWENLALMLNASGAIYADQKQLVKKKVSFNKSSKNKKTGGGPFEEKHLSVAEEQILEAAGIEVSVVGLQEICSFGKKNQEVEQCNSSEGTSTSQGNEADEYISEVMDIVDNEENEEMPKKDRSLHLPITRKEPRETKTSLLKNNISANDKYHAEVLKRLDKII
ncbi:hypothetical protein CVS40_12788 [Lucilia cuprina]|nr:hypothetical protein CVS40_12788 [Lucilia cuprina]